MSLISVPFNIQTKQIVIACSVVPSGSVRNFREQNDPSKNLPSRHYAALVDTGATGTAISPRIAKELELVSRALIKLQTASGTVETKSYEIDLILNFGNHGVPVEKLSVTEFSIPENSHYQMLLGMDVILRGHLSVSFDGRCIFGI